MDDRPPIDLIMPVFNECGNIERALRELAEKAPIPKRLIVVYDFDDDDTLPVLDRLAPEFPWVTRTKNVLGRGVLNAIRSGIAAATSDVVIITMADLSDDVAIIPKMVAKLRDEGFDIVCASRYMKGGRHIGGPWLKKAMSRTAGVSLHHLTGIPTHDATNAFRAYRREVLTAIPIESTGGFEYTLELTAKAYAAGYRITEVPSTWTDRVAGASRFELRKWLPKYLKWYLYACMKRLPN